VVNVQLHVLHVRCKQQIAPRQVVVTLVCFLIPFPTPVYQYVQINIIKTFQPQLVNYVQKDVLFAMDMATRNVQSVKL